MQLLLPRDKLIGIAVEGLSEEDQSHASKGTIEIADLTVYYGEDANFRDADRVETLQFKYAPKRAEKPFRASDAKKTLEKFVESYRDYKKNHGAAAVSKKLFFQLITNRPIFVPLQRAIDGIAKGKELTGEAKAQAKQFEKATGLGGAELAEFAGKVCIRGLIGTLDDITTDLHEILVDWSAAYDAMARARLGDMRAMVAKKAGYDAKDKKVIRQVDVLAALGLSDVSELLPCPESLVNIESLVEREQLQEAASLIPSLTQPLLIHAEGGVGKTVFLKNLESLLSHRYEVVFFDCFGGGAYRAPEDQRHRPNRGLVHIANVLACRGLCDPILPDSENTEKLFRTFRSRLAQCVRTLAEASPARELVLFIDAIDNAEAYAREQEPGKSAFVTRLLESIELDSIPGVRIVASSRTHRMKQYLDNIDFCEFKLHTFTIAETNLYLRKCLADITSIKIEVAQSLSNGNARILAHLASDKGRLAGSEIDSPIMLDDLLQERIDTALREAKKRYKKQEIDAFLAGLAVLPPPVPLDEYAGANDMDIGAIRSFAADLASLLDQTPQGMIFRDEPTETFFRQNYGTDMDALQRVASNLFARQADSVYAAQALPGLLLKLKDGEGLFKLAFDRRFPPKIISTVGQRRIRYARLKAAILHAANTQDNNRLVQLLVEFSSIVSSDQRDTDYIVDNPDLVANAEDVYAMRRLFEARTSWAGSRYARLTIASLLSGDRDDASRHFTHAYNRVCHDLENIDDNDYNQARPEHIDHAAIPLFHLAMGQYDQAIRFMQWWQPWYAFEIGRLFYGLSYQVLRHDGKIRRQIDAFLDNLTNEIGPLAGALSFLRQSNRSQRELLLKKLGSACNRAREIQIVREHGNESAYELPDGLRKAASIAVSYGMNKVALRIARRAPHQRPTIRLMVNRHSDWGLFPYIFHVGLCAVAKGGEVHERDILPMELAQLAKGLRKSLTCDQLQKHLKYRVQARTKAKSKREHQARENHAEFERATDHFFKHRCVPLLELTRALASFLEAPLKCADKPFRELVLVWVKIRSGRENCYHETRFNNFFQLLGMRTVIFALWVRDDLNATSVTFLLKHLSQQEDLSPATLIEVIEIIAGRPRFDRIAGKQAVRARSLIEKESYIPTRSGNFAELARAILPASAREAKEYFLAGLKQMDAIGAGDCEFTNALLDFASSIKGDELSEKDFHMFTNICELNMPHEAEKFPWAKFATAMSRIAGTRGLAKLCRWHNRGVVDLTYTLLPYLTALIRDGKINPADALALNRLANPAELWTCNSETLTTAIHEKQCSDVKTVTEELIAQYEQKNPGVLSEGMVKRLAELAGDVFGRRHPTTKYLSIMSRHLGRKNRDLNEQENYHRMDNAGIKKLPREVQVEMRKVREIAAETDPLSEDSLCRAMDRLKDLVKDLMFSREQEREFFRKVRRKVHLADRETYVKLVARSGELDYYAKFTELTECKTAWETSSANLDAFYQALATPILDIHAEDFLSFGMLSTYQFREVSDLTGVPESALAQHLIKLFFERDQAIPASIWLGLATIICHKVDEKQGKEALEALLKSDTTRLISTVVDGACERGLYPPAEIGAIASGFVWHLLGSPRATDRWRAAHSVRCFARLGRWDVIHALAGKLHLHESQAFDAPELPFYYLHARLWLLMAFARIAIDFPCEIAKHQALLLKLALESSHPHVVIQHFAAQALLACDNVGMLSLSEAHRKRLQSVNESPFPHGSGSKRWYGDDYSCMERPKNAPVPVHDVTLDYDFEKHEVRGLANVFAQPRWEVGHRIMDEIHRIDPSVTSMCDQAGREVPYHHRGVRLTPDFHLYGQYLGWHALRFVAGSFLSRHPIAADAKYGECWTNWLSRRLLARTDGLWLSDGMDRPPLHTKANLLERGKEGSVLTGNRDKLLGLVDINGRKVGDQIVVHGNWKSPDGIDVHICSALIVDATRGKDLVRKLFEKDAFYIDFPTLDDDEEEEFCRSGTEVCEYEPWIVSPYAECGELERYDPLSTPFVEQRPRFVASVANHFSLKPGDPFQRSWRMRGTRIAATTDVWGSGVPDDDRDMGTRLVCRTRFLSDVLEWKQAALLLLIKIMRCENQDGFGRQYSTTVTVLRVKADLKFDYFTGPVD